MLTEPRFSMVTSTIAGLMEITLTMETVAAMGFPDKGLTRPENGDILRLQYVLHDVLFLQETLLRHGLPAPVLLSADQELLASAQAEGLVIDDPSAHL